MRVFLYEYITGGGTLSSQDAQPPAGSLLGEGAAMISALAADFARLPETQVVALRDHRLADFELPGLAHVYVVDRCEQEGELLTTIAADVDWTVVIAPEFEGHLLDRVRWVEQAGGRLLSPNSTFVALTSNKDSTARQLANHGVTTPPGQRYYRGQSLPQSLHYPAILKPIDGAGSVGIRRIEHPTIEFDLPSDNCFRLEEFQCGTPASVAMLCGPDGRATLPACGQLISEDGSFQYLGGHVPLQQGLRQRAEKLALKALESLPPAHGYIGIDLVLGETAERDVVIEVNPRLTTSYVGLRRLAHSNLAAAMIDVAGGKSPELLFDSQPLEFSANGEFHLGDRDAMVGDGHRRGQPESRRWTRLC